MGRRVELAEVALPEFGLPSVQPFIPLAMYEARIGAALEGAAAAGYDALVVYGDREHSANVAYLTGYDPRFEETLLILKAGRRPVLLLGNEGMAYSEIAPVALERVLYQSFQPAGSAAREEPFAQGCVARGRFGGGAEAGRRWLEEF